MQRSAEANMQKDWLCMNSFGYICNFENAKSQRILRFLELSGLLLVDVKSSSEQTLMDLKAIFIIGGDGFLLENIHKYMDYNIPFFGVNAGTVGYRMFELDFGIIENDLQYFEQLFQDKNKIELSTLQATFEFTNPILSKKILNAVNDVTIYRKTNQAAKFSLKINDKLIRSFIADGILISTPFGSSAYNKAAGGTVLPLGSLDLSITAICPSFEAFSILVNSEDTITIEIHDEVKRPVAGTADFVELAEVKNVVIKKSPKKYGLYLLNKNSDEGI